ncbi:MAG: hypothetical protein DWQ36_07060 [Acidobacteria bacterium]|nr:MAG: hypothetical protein DWQ36_07060 [Acidobacteriota bacterium]
MQRRAFRWLVRLLPEEVRGLYAGEMESTFELERRHSTGRLSLLGLWAATIADILRTAPAEHLDILSRDARYALRSLWGHRAQTAAVVLTLAVAIGANVVLFAVVDAVLLEPLPYREPQQLVRVGEINRGEEPSNLGFLTFDDLRQRVRGLSHLVAVSASTATLTEGELAAERVNAMRVSHDYFEMLGVQLAHGRPFTEQEDRPGAARRVVILSHELFARRFGADPGVVGRSIDISGVAYQVVGVAPPGLRDLVAERLYRGAQLWYPLGYDPTASYACRSCRHLSVFARLAPGFDPKDGERELSRRMGALEQEHPEEYEEARVALTSLDDLFLGPVRPALLVLWGGVALLLLVACANAANVLLVRASEREHEVRVRAALGVTPVRLARQLMTESAILAVLAGVCGVVPAWILVRALAVAGPTELPRLAEIAVDGRVAVAALLLVLASSVLFGLAPLRHLAARTLSAVQPAARSTPGADTWRLRAALMASSVALAALLLIGSGLLVRSLGALLEIDPGFDSSSALTLQLWGSGERFRKEHPEEQVAAAVAFYDEVLDGIEALPGVLSAAGVSTLPLGGGVDGYSVHVVGRETDDPEQAPSADRFVVTPHFFETFGIPLEAGRLLDERDRQNGELTMVVNRTAADELFPGGDAIGRQLRLGPREADARTIVGVVADIRHHGLDLPPGYQVYVPQAQWPWAETFLTLVVRTEGAPLSQVAAVRALIRGIDPAQPISDVKTYEEIVRSVTATRRFAARLLSAFAGCALLIALVGLYGAVGVYARQHRREISLRMALGADAASVRRLVVRRGMTPVLLGIALGVAVALASTSTLRSLVYGVGTLDPVVFVGSISLLALAALVACWIPAWRAGRIDPGVELKGE